MLTQCPQPAYTTFQYKFRASEVGTHMYHAHSAADAADGLAGAFIVRQSPRLDPLRQLYDVEDSEHTIFVAEWGHSMGPLVDLTSKIRNAESLLINGKGNMPDSTDAPISKFHVEYGKRYRFRLAYAGGAKSCSVKLSIDGHIMRLIALDGHRVEPEYVASIEMGRGERADFVLDANRVPGVYKVKVVADEQCQANLEGLAELVYVNKGNKVLHKQDKEIVPEVVREFSTMNSARCTHDSVLCLNELHAADKLPAELAGVIEKTIYVPFNYSTRRISAKRVGMYNNNMLLILCFSKVDANISRIKFRFFNITHTVTGYSSFVYFGWQQF